MDVASLAFRTDLALLRMGGSTVEDRGDHLVVRTPGNPTFHWGNFVLLARPPAPDDVAAVLAEVDAAFPDARHRAVGIDGTDGPSDALRPLQAAGLTLETTTVLTARATRPPPRPATGVVHRPLVSDGDWEQRVRLSARCEGEPTSATLEFLRARAVADRALADAGHGAWWGAFDGERLVSSLGLFRTEPGVARFQTVETDPDHRGRGLAGTLVHHVAGWGRDALGARTLVIVADPAYVAIRVYRSVGFVEAEQQVQLGQPDRSSPAMIPA